MKAKTHLLAGVKSDANMETTLPHPSDGASTVSARGRVLADWQEQAGPSSYTLAPSTPLPPSLLAFPSLQPQPCRKWPVGHIETVCSSPS